MLKRRGSFQTVILIIFALLFITLTAKPSNGWESLSGAGSTPPPPPQAVPASPPPRSPTQGASATHPPPPPVAVPARPSSESTGALEKGRTIAFISNTNPRDYQLFRDWAGRDDSIQLILDPSSLDDLGKKLETLGRGRKISKLIFMGHGVGDARAIHFLAPNELLIGKKAFVTLTQNRPRLSEAFLPGAHLMFFNCMIGNNKPFLKAAGDAFLRTHGGFVIANTDATRFQPDVDDDGNAIIVWNDSPKWWSFPYHGDDGYNMVGNIARWFGEGWVTIEIPESRSTIEPDWSAGCPGPGAMVLYKLMDPGPYSGGSSLICSDRTGQKWLSPNGQRFRLVKSISKGPRNERNPSCYINSTVVTAVNPPHDAREMAYTGELCK